jgi:GNAT superfamily N-acetyltransferase
MQRTAERQFDQLTWFKKIISEMRDERGRPKGEVFIAVLDGGLAGLLTVFYKRWRDSLIAWVDLLGASKPFQGTGLESALLKQAISAARAGEVTPELWGHHTYLLLCFSAPLANNARDKYGVPVIWMTEAVAAM